MKHIDIRWLDEATALVETALKHYRDLATGAFVSPRRRGRCRTVRAAHDGATPSGNSLMIEALLRLACSQRSRRRGGVGFVRRAADSNPGRSPATLAAVEWLAGPGGGAGRRPGRPRHARSCAPPGPPIARRPCWLRDRPRPPTSKHASRCWLARHHHGEPAAYARLATRAAPVATAERWWRATAACSRF